MPSRIILVDGSGSITLDVIDWLSQQNVPLVRIDWRGNATTVISNSYGPDPKLVRAQLAADESKTTRLKIATALIAAKLKNSVETLRDLEPSDRADSALAKQKESLAELRISPPKSINALLGIEGRSALRAPQFCGPAQLFISVRLSVNLPTYFQKQITRCAHRDPRLLELIHPALGFD
jgi:CRISP-associated protein Cas1